MSSKVRVEIVSEFPSKPSAGIAYSLAGAPRKEIIYGTHVAHKYPAKFIPQIPQWALREWTPETRSTVLDPFCGSGTTLVEAGRLGHSALGCDISPLATLITRGKCALLTAEDTSTWHDHLGKAVTSKAKRTAKKLAEELRGAVGHEIHGLHYTWSNWFEPEGAAGIIAIRQAIDELTLEGPLRSCLLTSLSSIIKACSYLNEDQIKVRFDGGKKLADPFDAFHKAAASFLSKQSLLSKEYLDSGASFDIKIASASNLPFEDQCVDIVITSPPYINAVDYTMAHKYNLFLLGLLPPDEFKAHCRDYIGVTERAVRVADIESRPISKVSAVTPWVESLDKIKTPTSINRAFVVMQYFNGMYDSLVEAYRVLKNGGHYVMVVGETNRICGIEIPTASLIEACARSAGFAVTENFFHALANRSAMRLSRSSTGGEIPFERVFVFSK